MHRQVPVEGKRDDAGELWDSREHGQPHRSPRLKYTKSSAKSAQDSTEDLIWKLGNDKIMPTNT